MSRIIKSEDLRYEGQRDLGEAGVIRPCTQAGARAGKAPPATDDPPPPDPGAIVTEAEAKAKRIVDDARTRADEIVASADSAAQDVREQARRDGYDEGFDRGIADGEQAAIMLEEAAREALEQVVSERERVFSDCREQLIGLALEVARALLARELEASPDIVADMAERALAMVRESDRCVIRVHPRDVMVVEERRRELRRAASGVRRMDVVGDETLEPGEIVVDADRGQVDGTIAARLSTAADTLLEVVHDDADSRT